MQVDNGSESMTRIGRLVLAGGRSAEGIDLEVSIDQVAGIIAATGPAIGPSPATA